MCILDWYHAALVCVGLARTPLVRDHDADGARIDPEADRPEDRPADRDEQGGRCARVPDRQRRLRRLSRQRADGPRWRRRDLADLPAPDLSAALPRVRLAPRLPRSPVQLRRGESRDPVRAQSPCTFGGRMNRILAEQGGRVLAFGAHPDDLEVGAGGLLARLSSAGADVTLAIVSIPNSTEVRKAEAQAVG